MIVEESGGNPAYLDGVVCPLLTESHDGDLGGEGTCIAYNQKERAKKIKAPSAKG
jgi:hypothetical protein